MVRQNPDSSLENNLMGSWEEEVCEECAQGSPTTSLKSFDEISSLLLKRVGKPENSRPDCMTYRGK